MEPTTNTTSTTTDPRPQFAAAAATLRTVVAGIDEGRFGDPTPCVGMNVRDLIDHVGMAVGRVTAAGHAAPLEQWPTDGFSVGDDVVDGIDRLIASATDAWTQERLAEQVQLPWTTLSGSDALATYVNELLVHTWDLATATDQEVDFDADAVELADAVIHAQLPDAERAPMWEAYRTEMPEGIPFEAPFADAVPVPDDASPIVRLVAWNGRRP